MKKSLLLVAGLACLLLASVASAQKWMPRATVYVPFEFTAGQTVLPAGTYTVLLQAGHNSSQILLRNTESNASAFLSNIDIGMMSNTSVQNSNLIFVKDATGHHVLHQIWIAGDSHGHDVSHEAGIDEPR